MNIAIVGAKSSGKSTIGKKLSERLKTRFIDTDKLIEELYRVETGVEETFREIYRRIGEEEFRSLEERAINSLSDENYSVISLGGSAFLNPNNRRVVRKNSIIIFLDAKKEELWKRITRNGVPVYLDKSLDPKEDFFNRIDRNREVSIPFADILIDATVNDIESIVDNVLSELEIEWSIRMNAPNTLGEIVRISTFGESHGKALGVVLDGVSPGIPFDENIVQKELDRRKPGQSKVTTQRTEDDKVKILSGVFEGKTTGTPIAMIVENKDQDSSKYDNLKELFRPGHADYTFFKKYGIRDHRGGGRSSGRETIGRVASGAFAKDILNKMGITVVAYSLQIGEIAAKKIDYEAIEKNSVRCCDLDAAVEMEKLIVKQKNSLDSIGGIVGLEIKGLKAGVGDPVFGKLSSRLASALFTIGSVKGLEFGLGFEFAKLSGSVSNDPMSDGGFKSNRAGGILGGISTGEDIIIRLAVKPTPSISLPQETIDKSGENVTVEIKGRHDPCVLPRIIPVVESMASLVILDALEIQDKLKG